MGWDDTHAAPAVFSPHFKCQQHDKHVTMTIQTTRKIAAIRLAGQRQVSNSRLAIACVPLSAQGFTNSPLGVA